MTLRAQLVLAACGIPLVLAACDQLRGNSAQGEMRWARAALDRNRALTVLAEDDQAKVFTVRMIGSGEVRAVELAALAAGPQDQAGPQGVAPAQDIGERAPAAQDLPTPAPEAVPAPAPAIDATPHAEQTPTAPSPGQHVIASGPGYSIAAADSRAARAAPPPAPGTAAPLLPRSAAVLRSDPIICQGNRRLRIDGQNLEFSGDAIIAEAGCDLHITNSRIVAKGIAVNARAANVHVENSMIEGGTDSIDGSEGS